MRLHSPLLASTIFAIFFFIRRFWRLFKVRHSLTKIVNPLLLIFRGMSFDLRVPFSVKNLPLLFMAGDKVIHNRGDSGALNVVISFWPIDTCLHGKIDKLLSRYLTISIRVNMLE